MKYTDYNAVLTLATELNTNRKKLEEVMAVLEKEERVCREGIRDESGEAVTGFVNDIRKEVKKTGENLGSISRQLADYAAELIEITRKYREAQNINITK